MAVVLVVEDDEQVRLLAQSILQNAGHETRSAATLTEAHAILESDEKIDALFVDVTLPDHQEAGLELAEAATKTRPGLPVVYTTGRASRTGCSPCLSNRMSFSRSHTMVSNS